jgi:Putative polyhydroxyalkanoic acid system protein (PHA_gran_rgn)
MRIALPHRLGREEVRRRLQARSGEIAEMFPGGMAEVAVSWPHEDRMSLDVTAMGKTVAGAVEIAETEVAFVIELPAALGFVEPLIRGAIESKGRKLLN